MTRAAELLERLPGLHVAVLGDAMLDRYFRGEAYRISPEAPVPVVEIEEETEHPGGAANVAYNLATLGARTTLFGVVGQDRYGEHLTALLGRLGIGAEGMVAAEDRPTTVKTRVIAAGQHIVRVDRERKGVISDEVNAELIERLRGMIDGIDALILQDYNKGVLSAGLIAAAIGFARRSDVPVFVDPKRENFFGYQGVTLFKPNRLETEDALRRRLTSPDEKQDAARELLSRLNSRCVVLTLGPEGMVVAEEEGEVTTIPTEVRQVADVSGAGDTVIAALAAFHAAGASPREAAAVANRAAGLVCEKIGTVPIEQDELRASLSRQEIFV